MIDAAITRPKRQKVIGRSFSLERQRVFAELSGDYNPVHIDPLFARRSMFGLPIAHGIHVLLWALDCWAAEFAEPIALQSLVVDFKEPVPIDTPATMHILDAKESHAHIKIKVHNKNAVSIRAAWGRDDTLQSITVPGGRPERTAPHTLSDEEIVNASGELPLCLDKELAGRLFPNLIKRFRPIHMAVLLASTRYVGMKCPGLHSIYSGLKFIFDDDYNRACTFQCHVSEYDPRFSLLTMDVIAPGTTGSIRAFSRPAPQEQVRYSDITQVNPTEFSGQRALIVGGSRGLGEVTAKLLAAGGAEVKITYHHGKEAARKVADEIVAGGGQASFFALNVLDPTQQLKEQLSKGGIPTHLYYYATPFIFSATGGLFSTQLFEKFSSYYVTGFHDTVQAIQNLGPGLEKILYPSSVAVDELPADMGEYAAAKMAGETLCAFLQKTNPKLTVITPRLPRLATDQTMSLFPVNNQNPLPIILKELQRLRDI